MKNLYEKLKPEIRDSIQEDLKKYPATTMALIDSLKRNNFWSDLKVHDVSKLINFSHTNLLSISHMDLLYGDRFLVSDDEDYVVSITG
jgi:hypothetical protein